MIQLDLTYAEYAAIDAERWSVLHAMKDSPKHYGHAKLHPRPETTALALGRYVHTAVLQPHELSREFAIWTEGDRRGNDYKAFKAANAARTIFKLDEIEEMD